MHGIKNESVLGVLKLVSKYEENQVYGKPIPNVMFSKEVMETKSCKTYLAFATGNAIPNKARKRTMDRITPMKESITADDNIIPDDPDAAFELAKSISRTKAEEQEVARLIHETHEHLKTPEQSLKLKGMAMLSDVAMLVADTSKEIKASKCDLTSQHLTGGLSEGAGSKPEVPDELKDKSSDTSEGAGSKPEAPDVSKAKSSDQESKNES
nr:hypothetical protein [Tanacetum cinerariifolium]